MPAQSFWGSGFGVPAPAPEILFSGRQLSAVSGKRKEILELEFTMVMYHKER
jgi:hypothetical protein